MDKICATFEEWYLEDGTYPPLYEGQKVNLSFYMLPLRIEPSRKERFYLTQKKHSDYFFSGKIIRVYTDADRGILIVDTGRYSFYIESKDHKLSPSIGQFIEGEGQLMVDYYAWVENFRAYDHAPNLFYNLIVERLFKVNIPELFIHRHDHGFSAPTSLPSSDYTDNDLIQIMDMCDNMDATSFYLLELKPIDEKVPMTFIST